MLGAAGSVEMIVCTKAIQTDTVPPTINYEFPDPECDLDYVPNTARQMKVNAHREQLVWLRRAQCQHNCQEVCRVIPRPDDDFHRVGIR